MNTPRAEVQHVKTLSDGTIVYYLNIYDPDRLPHPIRSRTVMFNEDIVLAERLEPVEATVKMPAIPRTVEALPSSIIPHRPNRLS